LRDQCVVATVYNSAMANALSTDFFYRWLGPDGNAVDACTTPNCTIGDFHYNGGFLVGWSDYFYVETENRSPGWYSYEIWEGTWSDRLQTLVLRNSFELSDIDPVPPPEPKPNVSWNCSNNPDDSRTCTGNTDTLDSATETWTCTPIPDPDYPTDLDYADWDCSGDIDKRTSGSEAWHCDDGGNCTGNVDTSDSADETWDTYWSSFVSLSSGSGDIDKTDTGEESWACTLPSGSISCSADFHPWEWTCDGDYRGDWTCSGTVGRLAPIVGPVPTDFTES
jgi:hypothetical protein